MTHEFPVGTSEPGDFRLTDRNQPIDGTGLTVELDIATFTGGPVSNPPTADWLSPTAGTVRVTGRENLPLGTYLVRFKLTNQTNHVGWAPNKGTADIWRVVKVAAI